MSSSFSLESSVIPDERRTCFGFRASHCRRARYFPCKRGDPSFARRCAHPLAANRLRVPRAQLSARLPGRSIVPFFERGFVSNREFAQDSKHPVAIWLGLPSASSGVLPYGSRHKPVLIYVSL